MVWVKQFLKWGSMLTTAEDCNSLRNVDISLDDKTLSVGPRASDAYNVCDPFTPQSGPL